jgi:hypothetical protein
MTHLTRPSRGSRRAARRRRLSSSGRVVSPREAVERHPARVVTGIAEADAPVVAEHPDRPVGQLERLVGEQLGVVSVVTALNGFVQLTLEPERFPRPGPRSLDADRSEVAPGAAEPLTESRQRIRVAATVRSPARIAASATAAWRLFLAFAASPAAARSPSGNPLARGSAFSAQRSASSSAPRANAS